jgi:hypothetical protein
VNYSDVVEVYKMGKDPESSDFPLLQSAQLTSRTHPDAFSKFTGRYFSEI